MSLVFRKVRVEKTSNGQFVQNGILIQNNSGCMWYATKGEGVPMPQTRIADIPLNLDLDGAFVVSLRLPSSSVSMATIIVNAGDYFPFFSGFRLVLMDQAATIAAGARVLWDALFPAASSTDISGIAIKSGYTQNEIYYGFGGYHSNQGAHAFNTPLVADKPWRIGVELEVYARNNEARRTITEARTNWFQCESDSSLSDDSFGGRSMAIELKTIPLKACDATSVDFWKEPMERLAQLARSKGTSTTGLHVHISENILGDNDAERRRNLAKLLTFYIYMIEDVPANHAKNVIICGREHGYHCSLAEAKTEDMTRVYQWGGAKVLGAMNTQSRENVCHGLVEKQNGLRGDINTQHIGRSYRTIEFRKADGRISKTRLAAVCTWWEQMCLYCRNTDIEELDFDTFFRKVTNEFPCVAYFFQQDEEA